MYNSCDLNRRKSPKIETLSFFRHSSFELSGNRANIQEIKSNTYRT